MKRTQIKDERLIINNYNNTKEEEYFIEVRTNKGENKLIEKTKLIPPSNFIPLTGTNVNTVSGAIQMTPNINYGQYDLITKDYVDNNGGKATNVTYTQLFNLVNTNSLVPGKIYKLTDYRTRYIQPFSGSVRVSSVIEPLYITAIGTNKLHNVCKSELYPQDIIFYEVTGDINNGAGTEGFDRGKIYRRIDTKLNNDIGTDWRHIEYFSSVNNVSSHKKLFNIYNNTINNNIITNNILSTFDLIIGVGFSNNNIRVTDSKRTIIGNDFKNNNIGPYRFNNNVIGNDFLENIINSDFQSNIVENNFIGNNIKGAFISACLMKTSFISNTFHSGAAFKDVVTGSSFQNNNITGNITGGGISNVNTFDDDFKNNNIAVTNMTQQTNLISKGSTFRGIINVPVSSTEIQDPLTDVVVYSIAFGVVRQRYYNSSNVLVINNL